MEATLACWYVGTVCRYVGMLVCLHVGMAVCLCDGIFVWREYYGCGCRMEQSKKNAKNEKNNAHLRRVVPREGPPSTSPTPPSQSPQDLEATVNG